MTQSEASGYRYSTGARRYTPFRRQLGRSRPFARIDNLGEPWNTSAALIVQRCSAATTSLRLTGSGCRCSPPVSKWRVKSAEGGSETALTSLNAPRCQARPINTECPMAISKGSAGLAQPLDWAAARGQSAQASSGPHKRLRAKALPLHRYQRPSVGDLQIS